MEKTSHEERAALQGEKLLKSMEKLNADASGIVNYTRLLMDLCEHNEMVEVKEKELQSLSLDLERKRKIFEEEMAETGNSKKLVEEETDRKKKELAVILDKIKESCKQVATVDEQLESRRKLLEMQSLELVTKEKELECVRQSIKLCNSDLELKEKIVQSLNNEVTVCGKKIDSKSEELEEIKKLIKQQTDEFGVLHNQRDSIKLLIQELSEELVAKEKRHKEILEAICRSSSEMEERAKETKAAEIEASDLKVRSEKFRQEVEVKEKELFQLNNQIELEEKKLFQLKREMEEEIDRKKKDLVLILSKIEESGEQLTAVDEQVESQRKLLELQSAELVSIEMELECLAESSKCFEFDLEVKEKRVQALNDLTTISSEELDLKCKKLGEMQKLIGEQTNELSVMHKRHDSMKLLIEELAEELVAKEKRHKEILEAICKSSSEMESTKTEASDLNIKYQRLGREVEDREKELDQVKNQINSEENELIRLRKSIQDCTSELSSRRDQVEAMKNIQRELELKKQSEENELVRLRKSIEDCTSELSSRRDQVEAMKNIQREDRLKKQLRQRSSVLVRHEQQPASTPINGNDTSQQNALDAEPDIEDALTHYENSTLLKRNEVSSVLNDSPNPAEFVLELVQDEIREEVGLHDSLMKNWVLLFEELAKIQSSDKHQVQHKATQVATRWKEKITIEAPKSSFEVLAFLLFIVAYGLKELINEEETALLASSVARYKQAPGLFDSLSLKREIPECVKDLVKKRHYIPAVRLICLFNLNTELSPSELLMKEIINLKQKRPTESSQAKDKDAGRLRAILELVAAYKLEIDLPGDLVAKLVVKRENSTPPLVQCNVKKYGNSSSNPQANSPNLVLPSAQRSSVNPRVPKWRLSPSRS